jgi:hypothetical protein
MESSLEFLRSPLGEWALLLLLPSPASVQEGLAYHQHPIFFSV